MLQMHLMPKCILAYIFQRKMFSVHFPKENVHKNAFDAKMHLMLPLHFVYKMLESGKMHFGCAKMHLMPKCILATHHIFQRKMFSITFSKGKCSASHFPKENVQQRNAYIFQRKMFSFI